jgi:hypothetical protein
VARACLENSEECEVKTFGVRWQAERDTALDLVGVAKTRPQSVACGKEVKRRRRYALPAHSKTPSGEPPECPTCRITCQLDLK